MKGLYGIAYSYKLVMVYIIEKGKRDGDRESMVEIHLIINGMHASTSSSFNNHVVSHQH